MAKSSTISDDELLEHARAAFLERGIRTTTADVAERAGVSEGLLFKRFHSKDELFARAMAVELRPEEVGWLRELPGRVGQGTVPEQMEGIAHGALAFFEGLIPLVMMSWSNQPEDGSKGHAHKDPNAPPFLSRRLVEAYFESERRLGRIRSTDTEILARVFIGALYNYAGWQITLGRFDPRPLGPEAYVRGLVDLLWRGLSEGVAAAPEREVT